MKISELAAVWSEFTLQQKRNFVTSYGVEAWKRSPNSWSPKHPITGAPSRVTYATEADAAVEQIDWLVNAI